MGEDKDYLNLLKILMQVGDANAGNKSEGDGRLLYAEHLLAKFLTHSISIYYLSLGVKLQEMKVSYFDPANIKVLARASLESVLVFSYIYGKSIPADEADFRYWAWVMSDLMSRQKYPVSSEEGKQVLKREQQEIKDLQAKLKQNRHYLSLGKKQRESVLKGRWRFLGWKQMAKNIGLGTRYSEFYSHLCSYSHSGFLSVLQVGQATTKEAQIMLSKASLNLAKVCIANIVLLHCDLFPRAQAVFQKEMPGKELVLKYVDVGQGV